MDPMKRRKLHGRLAWHEEAHSQPASTVQEAEHPSSFSLFSSSQASGPATMPSPHTVRQTVPLQRKPASRLQEDEQPSSPPVLPSSHVSAPVTMPSPHTGTDGDEDVAFLDDDDDARMHGSLTMGQM
jgi:hypothetical protein